MDSGATKFPTTHWSLVKVVQLGSEADARAALETLCQNYWYPVYAYLRRTGQPPPDAEDLTQAFFHRLITERALHTARPEIGRLRSYLLGVLKRLLSDGARHEAALKRGGGKTAVSFDSVTAEENYLGEPHDLNSPDRLFDRAWAERVLVGATTKLHAAFAEGNNAEAFEHLREFLPEGGNATSYREVAARMGVEERVVRLQVHRMRQRYRKLIEDEVRQTVHDPAQVPGELEYLLGLVGR